MGSTSKPQGVQPKIISVISDDGHREKSEKISGTKEAERLDGPLPSGNPLACAPNVNVGQKNCARHANKMVPVGTLWEPKPFTTEPHNWEVLFRCEGPTVHNGKGVLPSKKLQGQDLDELPLALKRSQAVVLDLMLSSATWKELSKKLMEQAASASSVESSTQILCDGCKVLGTRIFESSEQDVDGSPNLSRPSNSTFASHNSFEPTMETASSDVSTEAGHDSPNSVQQREALDVSLCPLACIPQSRSPFVVLIRLAHTIDLGGQHVRFAALVLCSNSSSSLISARRVARSLVVLFSGHEFFSSARVAASPEELVEAVKSAALPAEEERLPQRQSSFWRARQYVVATCSTPGYIKALLQKYSIPLILGVVISLVWANIDAASHYDACHLSVSDDFLIFGHELSLHFFVNDIFMVFFFGLAAKEVTEAVLPGGTLYPLRTAVNPLMATCGGVIGPVATYFLITICLWEAGIFGPGECSGQADSDHRMLAGGGSGDGSVELDCREDGGYKLESLLKGWGVPTATDISLAWMLALFIFGSGHPAINYLLLLAVVDDALGMGIIAIFYPDPENPVRPEWLCLVVLSMLIAYMLRKARVNYWQLYVCIAGPVSWIGLLQAHVHPALSLVFVVPFMPDSITKPTEDNSASIQVAPVQHLESPKENPVILDVSGTTNDIHQTKTLQKAQTCMSSSVNTPPQARRKMTKDAWVETQCASPQLVEATSSPSASKEHSFRGLTQPALGAPRNGSKDSALMGRRSFSKDVPTLQAPTTPNQHRRSLTRTSISSISGSLETPSTPNQHRRSLTKGRSSISGSLETPLTPNQHRRSLTKEGSFSRERSLSKQLAIPAVNVTGSRTSSNSSSATTEDLATLQIVPSVAEADNDLEAEEDDEYEHEHDHEAPLHKFEHQMKWPVDMGMFFFGLVNAGVEINGFGGVTMSVLVSLVLGKMLGITFFGVLAVRLGFALPEGVTFFDLVALSVLAGMGLTVALFVAGVAFVDPGLQSQAKMGALLSIFACVPAALIRRFLVKDEFTDESSECTEETMV